MPSPAARRLFAALLALLCACAAPVCARGSGDVPAASEDAVPVPIIRLPGAVEQLHWSHDGGLFGYAEGNAVVVRDAGGYGVADVVRPGSSEVRGFVFSQLLGSRPGLLSVSEGYGLSVSGLGPGGGGTVVLDGGGDGGGEVSALGFDERSGYVAVGYGDGGLELALYLQYTRELSRYRLEGHAGAVVLVRFSTDSRWMASLSEGGQLRVWDVRAHRLVGGLEWEPPVGLDGMSATAPFAVFGRDMPRLLLPVDSSTLEVRGLDGRVELTVEVEGGVRGLRVNGEGSRVDVLTGGNRLHRYDLGTGRLLGHIPLLFNSEAVSFAVDQGEGRILVSYEDGSLVMMEMGEVFVPADGEVGAYQLILVNPDGTRRRLLTLEDLRAAGIDPDGALMNSYMAGPSVAGGPFHSVEALAGTTFLPEPFVASVDVQAGYVNGFLLRPLYFGGMWRSSWGFPRGGFPYRYYDLAGGEFEAPLLIDWVVEVPVGLRLEPWGPGGAEVRAEVAVGFAMHELWNRELGARAVTAGVNSGSLHGAFVAALTLGVGWKGALLKVSGEWDSEFGWTGQVSLGYSLRLPVPQRWSGGGGGGEEHGVFARSASERVPESAWVPEDAGEAESTVDMEAESVDAESAWVPENAVGVEPEPAVEIESTGAAEPAADVESEAPAGDVDVPGMDAESAVESEAPDGEAKGMRSGADGVIDYGKESALD